MHSGWIVAAQLPVCSSALVVNDSSSTKSVCCAVCTCVNIVVHVCKCCCSSLLDSHILFTVVLQLI